MNCWNTYYFIDEFNQICKQKNGVQKEFSEILELQNLIEDINEIIDENEQLKDALNQRTDQCDKYYKENEQLKQSYKEFEDECQSTFSAMSRKQDDLYRKNFKLNEENEQLKQKIGDLLYQIGEAGKNNKTCRECECFIPEHNICYMWDMEVEADDVVVACDQRKVRKQIG